MNPFSRTQHQTIVDVSSDLSELWSPFPKIIPNQEFPTTWAESHTASWKIFDDDFNGDSVSFADGDRQWNDEGAGAKGGGKGRAPAKNFSPRAKDDQFATDEDTTASGNVLANDSDRNGDPLTVAAVNGSSANVGSAVALASGALLTVNANGTFSYDPNGFFNWLNSGEQASDSFSYTASDGRGGTSNATVYVGVDGISDSSGNTAPTAVYDVFGTDEDTAASGNVLANDSDTDGDPLTVAAVNGSSANVGSAVTLASGALLTVNANGTFSYDPNGAFNWLNSGEQANDSFSYTASDGRGGTSNATVYVGVDGITDTTGDPSDPPYYVEALLLEQTETRRLNYPDNYGTGDTVNYAFLDSTPGYYSSSHWAWNSFRAFTDQQQQMTRDALDMIESYSNLRFVETTASSAEMTFGIADITGYIGYAYWPSSYGVGNDDSDVWMGSGYAGSTFTLGSAQYKTLIHEIGHAIGMKHPHTGSPNLPAGEDSRQYTVMSYSGHPTMSGDAETHMLYDIATVQYLYGANNGYATGNDVYDFADLNGNIMTIWDAGGHDVFDLSAASFGVDLDLRDGHYSTVASSGSNNIAIAFDTLIEDAFGGAYSDTLIGNATANVLTGGAGNDILTGGAGSDTFDFDLGWGRDTVTDFTRHSDRLDLRDTGLGFADFTITSSGGSTTVAYGADQITLDAVDDVTADDFWFASGA